MVVKRSVVISETLDFTRGGERIAFSSTINKRRLESIVGYFSATKETAYFNASDEEELIAVEFIDLQVFFGTNFAFENWGSCSLSSFFFLLF